jgi:novobiocin biosynthesis protein NovU/D-mycarose 3-C-methyltransferase
LLACYQKEGLKAVGVEPAKNLSDDANQRGLVTIPDYFGEAAVSRILSEWGPADIISGNNVFAHIDDIPSVLRNVDTLLDEEGLFIIEFPYLVTMYEKMFFDMIYHEHLSYIAVTPLAFLLEKFGMEIFQVEEVASHGGSLRVFIQKKGAPRPISPKVAEMIAAEKKKGYGDQATHDAFAQRVYNVRKELISFVNQAKREGKTVSGYGAPAKAGTIINFCKFTPADIRFIVDDNPLKQNRLSPGARIPVVSSQYLADHLTDIIIIFAWNFAPEIIKKLEPFQKKGIRFVIPLPKPKMV